MTKMIVEETHIEIINYCITFFRYAIAPKQYLFNNCSNVPVFITSIKTFIIRWFTRPTNVQNRAIASLDYTVTARILRIQHIFNMESFLGSIFGLSRRKNASRKVVYFIKSDHHERKTCLYYHNDKDKRRPSNIPYDHFTC